MPGHEVTPVVTWCDLRMLAPTLCFLQYFWLPILPARGVVREFDGRGCDTSFHLEEVTNTCLALLKSWARNSLCQAVARKHMEKR